MTDNRATQVSIEQFATTNPSAQITQVALEMWASASASIPERLLVTQVALEQWASATLPQTYNLAGNLGGASDYG